MTLRALIFDVDGTLAETEEAHRTAFNRSFARWGLNWSWSRALYRELLKTTGGKERIAAFQDSLAKGAMRLVPEDIARLHRDKTSIYEEIVAAGGLTLRPGVRELVSAARGRGLKLAVATTTSLKNVEALCRCCWQSGALEVFDTIAAGDMVAQKKPAPDVFELALAQLRLPASACLAFEDSEAGLISARDAGLRVVVTPSAYTHDGDFGQADWEIPSLEADKLPDVLSRVLSDQTCGAG